MVYIQNLWHSSFFPAGKTTFLQKVDGKICDNPMGTFHFKSITHKNLHLLSFDIRDHLYIRRGANWLMSQCNSLIYFVDSSDLQSLPESMEQLFWILNQEETR